MKCWLRFQTLLLAASITLLLLGGMVGCGDRQPTVGEIKIGVIAPLTGPKATIGQATVAAAELAVREANDAGGLPIKSQQLKVKLIIADDQDLEANAVEAALKLINQDQVTALVGLNISRIAIPVATVAEAARIPMISGKSTNPKTTEGKQYVFRVAYTDPFQGRVLARFTRSELGKTRAAVLYDIANPYNRGMAEIYKQVFEEAGGQVVAFESYTTDEKDFTNQLTVIKNSGAEILFLPNYYHEVPFQVQKARALGVTLPLIGSDSWGVLQSEFLAQVNGAYFTTHFAADIQTEAAKTFVDRFQKAYGKLPGDVAALTYDAFEMLFKAITTQGKADPESIRQGLSHLGRYQGVTGEMEYQGSGDPVKSAVIVKIQDGAFKFHQFAAP